MESLEQVAEESLLGSVGSVYESLRPKTKDTLTYEQKDLIVSLDVFEAPYLQEKLLNEGVFSSPEEYQEAFTEFKKYVALVGLYGKRISMASPKVDEVWHQFILFTREYSDFCDGMLGKFLDHRPKTSYTPVPAEHKRNLRNLYTQTFGEFSTIWDINADSEFDDDCTPSGWCDPNPPDDDP